jgi:ankyrin repeat protein
MREFVVQANLFRPIMNEIFVKYPATVALRNEPPIFAAVDAGEVHFVNALIEVRAELNVKDSKGRTPLTFAAKHGDLPVVTALVHSKADVDLPARGAPALTWAAGEGHFETVKFLVENGAAINVDVNLAWPLLFAAKGNHLDVIRYLIEHDANVNLSGNTLTALALAAKEGHVDVVRLLLEEGAVENLQYATVRGVMGGKVQVVELLLQAMADPNATSDGISTSPSTDEKWTLLMLAAREGDAAMVDLLMNYGADALRENSKGQTAVDLAMGNESVLDRLYMNTDVITYVLGGKRKSEGNDHSSQRGSKVRRVT